MAPNKSSNARLSERIPASTPVTLVFESGGQKVRTPARVLDISDNGMRLETKADLAKGQIVEVVSQHGTQEPERMRVAWVRKGGGEAAHEIGLEYADPHPAGVPKPAPAAVSKLIKPGGLQEQPGSDERQAVGDDRGPMAKE